MINVMNNTQFIESYPMGPLDSDSTSVLHETYPADDGEVASRLIGSENKNCSQSSTRSSSTGVLSSLRWWMPELFASLLSMVSFVSLVFVLRNNYGKAPNQIDLPLSIGLNGLVALPSTVNRVALMVPVGSAMSQEVWLWFSSTRRGPVYRARLRDLESSDAASRGAWGSLLLLFRARTRWLAYTGALVTISSFVFGTFTQQLIAYIEFPITSGILQAKNVDHIEYWQNFTGNMAEGEIQMPFSVKAAAYNGILSPNIPPLPVSCPTTNCTWPTTPSLAICGACSKSAYQLACNSTTATDGPGICHYKMPSGRVANLTNFDVDDDGVGFQVMPSLGGVYNSRNTSILYLANFDLVGAPADHLAFSWPNSSTVAAECAMWFCVQAYDISITGSQQTQFMQNFSQVVNSSLSPDDTGLYGNYTFLDLPAKMNPSPNSQYRVDYLAYAAIDSFLPSLFDGNVNINPGSYTPSSDFTLAVWNATSTDLDAWMKNVALSMTNALRAFNSISDDFYNGTGYYLGVQVRWRWTILPAALVVSSFLILIVTIVKTARSPVQAWKGSPLALLFIDVDQDMRKGAQGRMDTFDGLKDSVGKTRVMIKSDHDGNWAFKTA